MKLIANNSQPPFGFRDSFRLPTPPPPPQPPPSASVSKMVSSSAQNSKTEFIITRINIIDMPNVAVRNSITNSNPDSLIGIDYEDNEENHCNEQEDEEDYDAHSNASSSSNSLEPGLNNPKQQISRVNLIKQKLGIQIENANSNLLKSSKNSNNIKA